MDYSSTGSSQVTMSESKGLIPGVAPVAIPAVKAGVFAITALMYLDKSYIALRSIFVSIFGDYR